MSKKWRLIMAVVLILGIGTLTVWHSFELEKADKQLTDGRDSVVSIHCECGGGNAVFLSKKEDTLVFGTAAHVVQGLAGQAESDLQIEIAGVQTQVEKLWISNTYDVAFVEITMEGLETALKDKQPTGLSQEGYTNLKEEDTLWVWSYLGGELSGLETQVKSPWILIEDFGYHMIWARAAEAKGGMSGSGVFDLDGHLAGILCGGNETEIVVLPANIIFGELKNSSIDISFE